MSCYPSGPIIIKIPSKPTTPPSSCVCPVTSCCTTGTPLSAMCDSGWISANNSKNAPIVIKHELRDAPSIVSVMFSPNKEVVYYCNWSWSNNYSGNPVTIQATDETLTLQIFHNAPLHGAWDATTGQWTTWKEGYFRVLMYK